MIFLVALRSFYPATHGTGVLECNFYSASSAPELKIRAQTAVLRPLKFVLLHKIEVVRAPSAGKVQCAAISGCPSLSRHEIQ